MYTMARERLIEVVHDLDEAQASTEVTACPGWSVKDVVAHVVGIAADVTSGNVDGVGTDAWTAAQVESRGDRSLSAIVEEWVELASAVDALLMTTPQLGPRMARDALVHEFDIRAAVGRPGGRTGELVDALAATYAADYVQRVEAADGLAPVAVDVAATRCGQPDAPVVVTGPTFDLLRCLTGRRSRHQVEALDWTGRTDAHVALFTTYGAFPITDVDE